jgi:hypothetical protein
VRRALAGLLLATAVATGGAAAVHGERFARQLSRPHWEDFRFFRHNRAHVHSLGECFTSPPAWPGLYRPLSTSCYYFAGRVLFDNRVEAYHAVNAVVFVANAVLLFVVAGAVLPGRWPLVATLVFATRAAHAPLLVTTSEAQALLSSFFALGALACTLPRGAGGRGRGWAAAALFLAALLCKETVLVLPAIVMAHRRLFAPERPLRVPAFLLGAAAVWVALFAAARRHDGAPTGFDYDLSVAVLPRLAAHLLSFVNVFAAGPAQVEMPEAVMRWAFSPLGLGVTAALVAATLETLRRSPRLPPAPALRAAAFGSCWFVAGALPFLFFADRLFMRYGYFAHAGLAIVAAAAAQAAWGVVRAWRPGAIPATAPPTAP